VVGRLIQQQHVGAGHQGLRQGGPLAVATRQRGDARLGVEVQAVQGFRHPLLPAPATQCFDLALQGVQIAAAVGVVVNQLKHRPQPLAYRFKQGVLRVQCGFLRHIGDAQPLLYMQ